MLISVIIPTHNDAEYLRESLPSVLQQDYSGDMEIIVVDDGSEPPAEDLVPPEDSRVRFIRRLPGGVSAARNTGIDSAKGDILFFLDADDLMLPGRIRSQIQAFELDPDIGLVGGDITRRDLAGLEDSWGIFEVFGDRITSSKAEGDIHLLGADFWRVLLRQYPFNTSVMAVRREAARAMRFDTDLVCWEDWDFVVRTADNYRVAYCRRPMILYRKRIGSITTTPDPRKFLSRARMFRKWRGLFRDLDEETTRDLRLWENDALITASYEFRSQSRRLALEWAWQALIQRPRWKGIRALAGALIR